MSSEVRRGRQRAPYIHSSSPEKNEFFDKGILLAAAGKAARAFRVFKDLVADSHPGAGVRWALESLSFGRSREKNESRIRHRRDTCFQSDTTLESAGLLDREYDLRGLLRSVQKMWSSQDFSGGVHRGRPQRRSRIGHCPRRDRERSRFGSRQPACGQQGSSPLTPYSPPPTTPSESLASRRGSCWTASMLRSLRPMSSSAMPCAASFELTGILQSTTT